MDRYDRLFVFAAFSIQIVLLVFFAFRKWDFDTALRLSWLVYGMAIPAVIVSLVLMVGGKSWYLWIAGFLFAAWAILGYIVDIARPIAWRLPVYLPVLIPYVMFYLAGQMFYWWPLGTIQRSLWFIYAGLFAASTLLNISSHAWNN